MKKKIYQAITLLLLSFALVFMPNSKVLHAEESVEETSEEEQKEIYIVEEDECYYEFEIIDELKLHIYAYNNKEDFAINLDVKYVRESDNCILIEDLGVRLHINEDSSAYLEQFEEELEEYEEDNKVNEEIKVFWETTTGKIVEWASGVGIGGLITFIISLIYNHKKKKDNEENNERVTKLYNDMTSLLEIVKCIVNDNKEEQSAIGELYNNAYGFFTDIKDILESDSKNIEKIALTKDKVNALIKIIGKIVSNNPTFINEAEEINKLVDKVGD